MSTATTERVFFSSAEVARMLRITVDALQKAEREGRIRPAARETGGDDRIYYAEDIARLRAYFGR